ncbi:hypothetical protein KPL74_14780 [Bacillus sp. NP157]|nr:hypothetical protein KPL74_14780 [Bacillus sp. NP157]
MLFSSRWFTAWLAFGLALAAAVQAQDRDPPRPPPHDPRVEAALDDCWVEYGREQDDPVPPEMMAQCMADKGFTPPPRPRHGPPPPPPPGDEDDDDDFDNIVAGP